MLHLETVLCAVDASPGAARALAAAADLAERTGARLHLLHAAPLARSRMAPSPGGGTRPFPERARAYVDGALGEAGAFRRIAPAVHETHAEPPAAAVRRVAEAIGADLIVLGTHGRTGLAHLFLGSVAADVVRRASVPVLVVPARADRPVPGPDRPVVIAVDESGLAERVLRLGRDLAVAAGARPVLVHVREAPPDTLVGGRHSIVRTGSPRADVETVEETHALFDRLLASDPTFQPERHLPAGAPGATLIDLAERLDAGAIVLGTAGRTGLSRLGLGSVAEYVARHAPCPVLTLSERAAARVPTA